MAGSASISRLTGFSSLIAFSLSNKIQRSMNVHEKTDWANTLFSLLFANFWEDKDFAQDFNDISIDLQYLRENYDDVLDYENWAIERRNDYNLFLDHIERRIYQIIKKSKIIDTAGLREMVVPE